MRFILAAAILFAVSCREAPSTERPESEIEAVEILSALTDPEKLDTLEGKRAATPRFRKACY